MCYHSVVLKGSVIYWWIELGYPDAFDLGKDGFFPRPGQVVKYYRERKMDDKGKAWTQKNLAKTLGLTDNGVRDIENRDVGMDDFDRRQLLSKLFGIPPLSLGIITPGEIDVFLEKQRKANKTVVLSTPTSTSRKLTIDTKEYGEQLRILWTTKKTAEWQSSLEKLSFQSRQGFFLIVNLCSISSANCYYR